MKTHHNKANTTPSFSTGNTPPTIPLIAAIKRAQQWRQLVQKINIGNTPVGEVHAEENSERLIPQQLLFRAINIRMADIDWLKQQHPDAASIRLYMSVPHPDAPFQIDGMLVPVDAQNQDMLTMASGPDVTEYEMQTDSANSTIYDFTQPCPTLCNSSSPLFNETNSVAPYLRYK